MLSIESMTITAYISDGSVLCRACGEKAKLPASDAQCDYTMQSDFYDGVSCDDCGEEIVEYPEDDPEEEEDIDPIDEV